MAHHGPRHGCAIRDCIHLLLSIGYVFLPKKFDVYMNHRATSSPPQNVLGVIMPLLHSFHCQIGYLCMIYCAMDRTIQVVGCQLMVAPPR